MEYRESGPHAALPPGDERIAPLVSPRLLASGERAAQAIQRLVLIESQLSPVDWAHWFQINDLALPPGPRQSFDRAAMAIAAAVDGLGVALESTRLAWRELERGDRLGYGFIKTYRELRPGLQQQAVQGAHARGLPVTAHAALRNIGFGGDRTEHMKGSSRTDGSS